MERLNVRIDDAGRVILPPPVLRRLGLRPRDELVLEVSESGVSLKAAGAETPVTQQIASMNLPISDWPQMKNEIDSGR